MLGKGRWTRPFSSLALLRLSVFASCAQLLSPEELRAGHKETDVRVTPREREAK